MLWFALWASTTRLSSLKATEEGLRLASKLKGVNLYFIGAMGAGKTSVGDAVCRQIGSYTFIDLDDVIEKTVAPIPQIFEENGEDGFRNFESEVLTEVSAYVRMCVATGGGVVLRPKNWGALRNGIVVFLDASVDLLESRLDISQRPLLSKVEDIRDILNERRKFYENADVSILVTDPLEQVNATASRVVDAVIKFIDDNPPAEPPKEPSMRANINTVQGMAP